MLYLYCGIIDVLWQKEVKSIYLEPDKWQPMEKSWDAKPRANFLEFKTLDSGNMQAEVAEGFNILYY